MDLAGAGLGAERHLGGAGLGAVRHLGGASAVPLALLGLLQPDHSGSVFFFTENEEDEPRCVALTNQHKSAIRFIRKLKYFLARKRFREALKPYDVKDVIEQYSSGHADLLNRTRNLQFRLDQILGKQGSKAKDVYASKISLASRVVKVERQVDDIESKLDQLLELYLEDRKRFPALMEPVDEAQGGGCGESGEPPQPPPPSAPPRPRPILVDKQCSEPSSPVALGFNQTQAQTTPPSSQLRRPMHRGYSDLGNRIRKRVTLSGVPQCGEAPLRPHPPTQDSTGQLNDNVSVDGSDSGSADDAAWAVEDGGGMGDSCERDEECLARREELEGEGEGEGDYDSLATEDTALLRVAATTEIIITPISGGGRPGARGRRPGDAPVPLDLHLLRPDPPRARAAEEV